MIPKKIHYCWFGGNPLPKSARKCIDSWRKFMPDYEIVEWNEDNFDVNYNAYTKMCYGQKKFAFLTDYLRLLIVEEQGGIYFDTDVEVLRSFDDFIDLPAFVGFENDRFVNTGEGFGAEPHNPTIQQMLRAYDPLLDGAHGVLGCPKLNTEALQKLGLRLDGKAQTLPNVSVFPAEYFNPRNSVTGELTKTENTYSIHWYSASWLPWHKRLKSRISKPFHRIFGVNCFRRG